MVVTPWPKSRQRFCSFPSRCKCWLGSLQAASWYPRYDWFTGISVFHYRLANALILVKASGVQLRLILHSLGNISTRWRTRVLFGNQWIFLPAMREDDKPKSDLGLWDTLLHKTKRSYTSMARHKVAKTSPRECHKDKTCDYLMEMMARNFGNLARLGASVSCEEPRQFLLKSLLRRRKEAQQQRRGRQSSACTF